MWKCNSLLIGPHHPVCSPLEMTTDLAGSSVGRFPCLLADSWVASPESGIFRWRSFSINLWKVKRKASRLALNAPLFKTQDGHQSVEPEVVTGRLWSRDCSNPNNALFNPVSFQRKSWPIVLGWLCPVMSYLSPVSLAKRSGLMCLFWHLCFCLIRNAYGWDARLGGKRQLFRSVSQGMLGWFFFNTNCR